MHKPSANKDILGGMANPDLVSYIREQTHQGVSAHVLREALLEIGWREGDIDNAFHDVAAGLQPLTTGVALHEDLAQVRGMVTHLAHRVQRIETTLTTSPVTHAPQALAAPHVLPAARPHHAEGRRADPLRFFISIIIALGGGFYLSLAAPGIATSQLIGAGMLGLGLLFGALVVMRRHSWLASLLTGSSIALLLMVTQALWRVQHLIEMQTVVALGLLWVVVVIVMERWIRRFEQRYR